LYEVVKTMFPSRVTPFDFADLILDVPRFTCAAVAKLDDSDVFCIFSVSAGCSKWVCVHEI
jgi:hypothetical protein